MTTPQQQNDLSSTDKPKKTQRSARRRSREFILQGIYQWLITGNDVGIIDAQIRGLEGFRRADFDHYETLLQGVIREASHIDDILTPHVDRKTVDLSPIEHGILMLGTYELLHCLDIPYRVIINEAVELAKTFGGTDGFKYVNGVLDKVALQLRESEQPQQ